MTMLNPWQIRMCGEYLASLHKAIVESDMREAERARKEAYRKEQERNRKRLEEKEAEEAYRRENPHATWLFEHFDFGHEYIYYKTLY